MIQEQAISMARGDSFPLRFALKDATGAAIDITGGTFSMTVNAKRYPLVSDTPEFAVVGVIADAEGGLVDFTPTTTDTDLVGAYWYDVQMTLGGAVRTIVTGQMTFTQDITK